MSTHIVGQRTGKTFSRNQRRLKELEEIKNNNYKLDDGDILSNELKAYVDNEIKRLKKILKWRF